LNGFPCLGVIWSTWVGVETVASRGLVGVGTSAYGGALKKAGLHNQISGVTFWVNHYGIWSLEEMPLNTLFWLASCFDNHILTSQGSFNRLYDIMRLVLAHFGMYTEYFVVTHQHYPLTKTPENKT